MMLGSSPFEPWTLCPLPDASPRRVFFIFWPSRAQLAGCWPRAIVTNMFQIKFFAKRSKSTKDIVSAVSHVVIHNAYRRREKEIESLRQYDRGEKQIYAPDIRTLVRGVR